MDFTVFTLALGLHLGMYVVFAAARVITRAMNFSAGGGGSAAD